VRVSLSRGSACQAYNGLNARHLILKIFGHVGRNRCHAPLDPIAHLLKLTTRSVNASKSVALATAAKYDRIRRFPPDATRERANRWPTEAARTTLGSQLFPTLDYIAAKALLKRRGWGGEVSLYHMLLTPEAGGQGERGKCRVGPHEGEGRGHGQQANGAQARGAPRNRTVR